ncbi:AAA-domain-containing protein [Trametopsis cervina]|nr:AAA-domain-containing protein [Trametopsis cervina]
MATAIRKTIAEAVIFSTVPIVIWYSLRYFNLNPLDPRKPSPKTKPSALLKLGFKDLVLDEYERQIAAEVIHPDDIDVRFEDIGGLDPIIASLRESVIYPLQYPDLFGSSSLLGAPKGVLLFGPPGCGKTMMAKALAKESGATFINIAASVITSKWFGDSNKLVAALFSLARKTQPSIVFIDEIDSFLRQRQKEDHEATGMMKAEFMTLWDGLLSNPDRIVVLGATNRPNDIDSAILRRMPKRFSVGLPTADQRLKILNLVLKDTKLCENFPIFTLAEQTEGYSGSELKELCRNAAMLPMRELLREVGDDEQELARLHKEGLTLRPLVLEDFFQTDGTSPLPSRYDASALEVLPPS